MKDILISIKNIFKYGRKTIAFTWLFFFIISTSSESPHNIFVLFLLSGLYTFIIIIIASVLKYLKLL